MVLLERKEYLMKCIEMKVSKKDLGYCTLYNVKCGRKIIGKVHFIDGRYSARCGIHSKIFCHFETAIEYVAACHISYISMLGGEYEIKCQVEGRIITITRGLYD
jgi:hypothetical protein